MTVSLLGAADIRRLAAELDVTPTKKLGQNFVVDANTVRKIVHAADVRTVRAGRRDRTGARIPHSRDPGDGSECHGRRDRSPSGRTPAADRARSRSARGGADRRRRRRDARDRAAGNAHRARRESAVQRLGAGAAALPRDVPLPRARGRHGAGGGRRAAGGGAPAPRSTAPRASRRPGTVRGSSAAPCRARCSGRCRTWTACSSASTGIRSRAAPRQERIRTFAIVDAAFNQRRKMLRQALSGFFGSSAEASAVLEAAGVAPTARGEDLTVRRLPPDRAHRRVTRVVPLGIRVPEGHIIYA